MSRLLSVKATTAPPPCTFFRCSLPNPLSLGVPVCSMGIKSGARFPRVLGRFSQFTFIHRLESAIWEALYNMRCCCRPFPRVIIEVPAVGQVLKWGCFLVISVAVTWCLYFIYFLFLETESHYPSCSQTQLGSRRFP